MRHSAVSIWFSSQEAIQSSRFLQLRWDTSPQKVLQLWETEEMLSWGMKFLQPLLKRGKVIVNVAHLPQMIRFHLQIVKTEPLGPGLNT